MSMSQEEWPKFVLAIYQKYEDSWADQLEWVDDDGQLTEEGKAPEGVEFNDKGAVVKLDLSGRDLEGSIPVELSALTSLDGLDLSDNKLTGVIPKELGELRNLTELNLYDNDLAEGIPKELFDLPLTTLDLSDNNLTGKLPAEIGKLRNTLEFLYLSSNYLEGTIPASICELTKLQVLELSYNGFVGELPADIGNMSALEYIYIVDCALSGAIPESLYKLVDLQYLRMEENELEGKLSEKLRQLQKLSLLTLSSNKLSGPLPSAIGELANLTYLDLEKNEFGGKFPKMAKCVVLEELYLDGCGFTGTVPADVAALKNLTVLSIPRNKLTGGLPAEALSSLTALTTLDVGDNKLQVFDDATRELLLKKDKSLETVKLAGNDFPLHEYEKYAKQLLLAPDNVRDRQDDDQISWFAVAAAKKQQFSAAVTILQLKPSSAPISALKALAAEYQNIKYVDLDDTTAGSGQGQGQKDQKKDAQDKKEEYKRKTDELKRVASFMVWHAPSGDWMTEALQQDNNQSKQAATESHTVVIEWLDSLQKEVDAGGGSAVAAATEKINYHKRFDEKNKENEKKAKQQTEFIEHVSKEIADSDAMQALIEEDTSFGIFSIFVVQCAFLWRHFKSGAATLGITNLRRTLELVLLVFTPLAIFSIQWAFPILIMYDEVDYLMLSGLDSGGYTNWGTENVYFCPNSNINAASSNFAYTSSEGFHGSVQLQRAAATFIAILYFSRYFMVARAKLSPPRARTEPEMRMAHVMEISYLGSWRMGLVDDFMDVVYEGTVYAINLRVALTGTSLINIVLNSLALEFIMTLDNDWKESYGKVYGNEVKAYLKRECYLDHDGFIDQPPEPAEDQKPKSFSAANTRMPAPAAAAAAAAAPAAVKDGAYMELASGSGNGAPASAAESASENGDEEAGEDDSEGPEEETPELSEEEKKRLAVEGARKRAQEIVWYINSCYVVLLEAYFLLAACWVPFCDTTTV